MIWASLCSDENRRGWITSSSRGCGASAGARSTRPGQRRHRRRARGIGWWRVDDAGVCGPGRQSGVGDQQTLQAGARADRRSRRAPRDARQGKSRYRHCGLYTGGPPWQAVDDADGLVRTGVQSALARPDTAALIRRLMTERGLPVPPTGSTIESVCVVPIGQGQR